MVKSHQIKIFIISIILVAVFILAGFFYYRSVGQLEFYRRHHDIIQPVKKIVNILYLPQSLKASKLERFDIIIDTEDWQFLDQNLPVTYQGKTLSEQYRQKVKAKFKTNKQEYSVEVRYRGETDVHWRDPKKSWLIDFGKYNFEGKKEIHLVIPKDRNYLLEELNLYRARRQGLLVPETKFVNLFVNNNRQGVYWMHEGWDQELLSRQGVSDQAILYGGRDELAFEPDRQSFNYFDHIRYWRIYSDTQDFSKLTALLDLINNQDQQYFDQQIAKIIDLDNFLAWQINQCLIASAHQAGANMKLYFDPTIERFRFIPWDIAIGNQASNFLDQDYNRLVTRVLANPEYLKKRNQLLLDYVSDDYNLADDLMFYQQLDELTKNDFYKDYRKVDNHFEYRRQVASYKIKIIQIFNDLKDKLQTD